MVQSLAPLHSYAWQPWTGPCVPLRTGDGPRLEPAGIRTTSLRFWGVIRDNYLHGCGTTLTGFLIVACCAAPSASSWIAKGTALTGACCWPLCLRGRDRRYGLRMA